MIKKILFLGAMFLAFNAEARDCLNKNMITDWRARSPNHVVIFEGRRAFDVQVWHCPDLRWADRIWFRTWPNHSAWVCAGDDLLILDYFGNYVRSRCRIQDVRRRNFRH
jgi:hypothetical protein